MNAYVYDAANRLISMDGIAYTWDANGNLLSDGARSYTYDAANRLIGLNGVGLAVSYGYNGLGDRWQQTVNSVTTQYTLDLNAGLTQVLQDGTNTYLYGVSRIAQYDASSPQYFLGDALGSVRQLVDASGNVTLAKSYQPYGEVMSSAGSGATSYGFTNEWTSQELIYLRARWYSPSSGRFISKDVWQRDNLKPMSYNLWLYGNANPLSYTDPTGHKLNPLALSGYIEGRSYTASALLMMFVIEGEEIVYDFATLESGRFHYTGVLDANGVPNIPTGLCSSILNISGSPYISAVFGFDEIEFDNIRTDYSGPFVSIQLGPDIPIPILLGIVSAGGGVIGFSSVLPGTSIPNLDVWGFSFYMDISAGAGVWDLPIWISLYKANYTLLEHKSYDGVLQMAEDIKSGKNSPIDLPIFSHEIRNFAANSAIEYRRLLEQ